VFGRVTVKKHTPPQRGFIILHRFRQKCNGRINLLQAAVKEKDGFLIPYPNAETVLLFKNLL
jgi:hypothetical protein